MNNCSMIAISGAAAVAAAICYILFGPKQYNIKPLKGGSYPGLDNLGNTCFLNCILQSLASLPAFVIYLKKINANSNCNKQNKPLTNILAGLLDELSQKHNYARSLSASSVLEVLFRYNWIISSEQHDAHEMYHALLTTLVEETDYNDNLHPSHDLNNAISYCSNDEIDEGSAHAATRTHAPVRTLDRKGILGSFPFHGLLASQMSCLKCRHKNPTRYDIFDSISLSIPTSMQKASYSDEKKYLHLLTLSSEILINKISHLNLELEDCIKTFLMKEYIDDVICDNCSKDNGKNGKATRKTFMKETFFGKLPQCLCIHIQRIYWNSSGSSYKCDKFIPFPPLLDMTPFTVFDNYSNPNGIYPNKLNSISNSLNDSASNDRKFYRYKLVAVVCHFGSDGFDGHFVSYRTDKSANNSWYYISDNVVRTALLSEVLLSKAYLIFYERL
ncbi:Ubiquitin carboxyl-terminal hydrolase 30 [Trichoplax sp. H2]|nr:Ubiquitin carboxyl-terminal hydrolase 30 [Trichoplax sp. H2]|eukprot:RDD47501.1 Ubiquitin carboxyl-terminal hydrolase 30 [Trichoplax sp. H2]